MIINTKSTEEINAGEPYDPLNGVSATDGVDGILPVENLSYTSNPAFDANNPFAGTYTFSYTATDTASNSSTLNDSRVLTVHATTVTGTNRVVDATNLYTSAFNGRWDTGDNFNNGCALLATPDTKKYCQQSLRLHL